MGYECGNCGKGLVDMPGKWCSECQEKEYYASMASESHWFNESALCQRCGNAEGPDSHDNCLAYNMPLYMVKRKRKCKHYKEYVYYGDKPCAYGW